MLEYGIIRGRLGTRKFYGYVMLCYFMLSLLSILTMSQTTRLDLTQKFVKNRVQWSINPHYNHYNFALCDSLGIIGQQKRTEGNVYYDLLTHIRTRALIGPCDLGFNRPQMPPRE